MTRAAVVVAVGLGLVARADKTWTLDDLKALDASKSWAELIEHARGDAIVTDRVRSPAALHQWIEGALSHGGVDLAAEIMTAAEPAGFTGRAGTGEPIVDQAACGAARADQNFEKR